MTLPPKPHSKASKAKSQSIEGAVSFAPRSKECVSAERSTAPGENARSHRMCVPKPWGHGPFFEKLTALSEKLLYHLCRTSGQNAAPDFHLMIQTRVIHHLQNRTHGARLRIIGTVHQTAEAGMNCGSRAHDARLNRSKQFAVDEPVIADVASRLAQRHDFSVSCGIIVGEVAIPASSNHAPFGQNDGSDGYLARIECPLGAA